MDEEFKHKITYTYLLPLTFCVLMVRLLVATSCFIAAFYPKYFSWIPILSLVLIILLENYVSELLYIHGFVEKGTKND